MKKPNGTRRIVADKRFADASTGAQPPAADAGLPPQKARRRASTKKAPPRRRGNVVTRGVAGTVSLIWRIIWGSFWRLGLTVLLILLSASAYYYSTLPEPQALFDGRARGSVTMLDRDGRVFAWRGETFGTVSADKIAPVLKDAVVATEDRRFYSHLGVDPRGIASAIRINLAEGRGPLEGNGGSTITQQVAKLLCLGESFDPTRWKSEAEFEAECRQSSLWRKVKEVPYALAMETKYSKEDILNIYMNRSYLGAGARGFEAASQRYFGKPAADVSAPEAAMLAGLLKAPSYFAPTGNLTRARDRAAVILGLMHEQDYLTDEEFAQAKANPAALSKAAAARAGGYFADWVMESGPGFLTSETTEDVTITTTFDQRIQRAAERALNKVFDEKVKPGSKAQAAVVIMSADGAVRAMIGGRDSTVNGAFNRATQAVRQPGSAFKPFVYAAALDMGYGPGSTVLDAPLTINVRGSGPWSPQNYTRNYRGEITLTAALSNSINTSTIRLQEAVGRDAVRRVARDFGFAHDLASGPSLGLGVSESTLLEMTGAYAGIRNGGTSVRPYGLVELRIKGDDTALMGQAGGLGKRVISPKAASDLIGMMREVIRTGTGTRARLPGDRDVAGKTGTTSSYRDAWFIGFTQQYVAGVWMGYDDNTQMTGVTGGGLPAEIWREVMAQIHEGLPNELLDTTGPDGGGPVPQVVAVSDGDPLAAALAQAVAEAALVRNVPGGGAQAPMPDRAAGSLDAALADAMVTAQDGADAAVAEILAAENLAAQQLGGQVQMAPIPELPDAGASPAGPDAGGSAPPADVPPDDALAAALGAALQTN
ncbi:transglycosylase domain-containing protein [uncultured Paracoccus sp.]|uniref:transglycosylase domain-containing protein n=1 Tax=uncultured Paracoccus sp. TaxID=189685 RepID=UPI00261A217A|nr:PBP1A family penicillin-binding protein [uncultured Paracoccus sp.]